MLLRHVPFVLALLALTIPAHAAPLGPDLFPDAPRGTLDVHIEISGVKRWSNGNSIEFTNFKASRTADMHLQMVLTSEGRAPMVAIRGHDLTNPELPEAQTTLSTVVQECAGDLACQIEAISNYDRIIQADPNGMGTTELDEQRCWNWVSDRSGTCATGSLSVADSGNGMAIQPPDPAAPFRFTRSGEQNLASAPFDVLNRVCEAWLSYDSDEAVVSIRLPVYGLWVDTSFGGDLDGDRRLHLIEGGPSFAFSLDQSTEYNDGALSGIFEVDDIGVANLYGGYDAPVSATITWSLSPELQ